MCNQRVNSVEESPFNNTLYINIIVTKSVFCVHELTIAFIRKKILIKIAQNGRFTVQKPEYFKICCRKSSKYYGYWYKSRVIFKTCICVLIHLRKSKVATAHFLVISIQDLFTFYTAKRPKDLWTYVCSLKKKEKWKNTLQQQGR